VQKHGRGSATIRRHVNEHTPSESWNKPRRKPCSGAVAASAARASASGRGARGGECPADRVLTRGKWRTVEVLACPVTFSPHPHQIDAARRAYDDWWQALGWIRDGLIMGGMLRDVEVTSAMPVSQPWTRGRALG